MDSSKPTRAARPFALDRLPMLRVDAFVSAWALTGSPLAARGGVQRPSSILAREGLLSNEYALR